MNILVLNWRDILHPRAGGAEVHLHEIFEKIAALGHKVTVITSLFEGAKDFEQVNGLDVYRFGNDTNFWLICAKNLATWEKQFNIDVVVEDFNKLPFFSPICGKAPRLIQMHHLWKFSIFREASFPLASFVWLTEQTLRFFYKKEKFVVVSPSTKKELASMGIKSDDISIIYNGCDLDFYKPIENVKRTNSLLWLGRIQKYKGIMDALIAFKELSKQYPELTLDIAGSGPYKAKAQAWVEQNGLNDKVNFLGFVSNEKKLELLQTCKFVLQTSYKEGWGLTVIEANACGAVVLANDAPGLCDSVVDNYNGLLYKFASIEDLISKSKYLLDTENLLREMSQNAISRANEFVWEKSANQTLVLLENIVKNK